MKQFDGCQGAGVKVSSQELDVADRAAVFAIRMELEIERSPVSATTIHPGGIQTNIAPSDRGDPWGHPRCGRRQLVLECQPHNQRPEESTMKSPRMISALVLAAGLVLSAGGVAEARSSVDTDKTVQGVSTMDLGSGRVVARGFTATDDLWK